MRTDVTDNALTDAEAYKARSASAKFKQQMSYGIGAAMVFGLVSVLSKLLVDATVTAGGFTMAAALPIAGLVGLGVMGVGCLYLSARYLSENTFFDQAMAAKQISAASRVAPAPAVAPTVDAPKSTHFPDAVEQTEEAAPKAWADQFAPRDNAASWVSKTQAAPALETARA